MLRWMGLGFLFLGCSFFGVTKSRELKKRLEMLEEFRRVLLLLAGEIRCVRSTLPEAFERISGKVADPFDRFLKQVARQTEKDGKRPFFELYEEALQVFQGTPLKKEDRGLLRELGQQLGYLDVQMQLGTLELYEELVREEIQKAAAEYGQKARMYRYLGVLTGVFLVVFLA